MSDIKVFHHHLSMTTFIKLLADALLCFFAAPFVVTAIWDGTAHSRLLDSSSADALWIAGGYAVAMPMVCSAVGFYRRTCAPVAGSTMLARGFLALLAGTLITYLTLHSGNPDISNVMVVATALGYIAFGLFVVRLTLYAAQQVFGPPRVLIVGTCNEALALAKDLASRDREVVGFYPTGDDAEPPGGSRVFSRLIPLEDTVASHRIDEIVVATREQRGGAVPMEGLLACRIRGVRVMDLAAVYERTHTEVPVDSLKASWLVYGDGFVQGWFRRIAKRTFDIVSSAMLLMLASPLMALTALAIRVESRGPVIYRQERIGLLGSPFMCLKFRSMRLDAEADGVPRWAARNDNRITSVGKFIRKTRIDELPQLISVLKGEMSMVGPRPERPSFVTQLHEEIPFYDLRHTMKPGITGWAQIRYRYGASVEDARKKHQFDLYYIKNNSLFLDFLVLIETVTVVLFGEGAN